MTDFFSNANRDKMRAAAEAGKKLITIADTPFRLIRRKDGYVTVAPKDKKRRTPMAVLETTALRTKKSKDMAKSMQDLHKQQDKDKKQATGKGYIMPGRQGKGKKGS